MSELTVLGCTEAQLAAAATWTRDVLDNYVSFYEQSDLGGSPSITAYSFNEEIYEPQARYICFGNATETTTKESLARSNIFKKLLAEKGFVEKEGYMYMYPDEGVAAQSWLAMETSSAMSSMLDSRKDPFKLEKMSVSDFFKGHVIIQREMRVSRTDIILYECYTKGRTHARNDRHLKKHAAMSAYLDTVDAAPMIFRRNNVDYLLLSIIRDITSSSDAIRFIEKFK